MPELIPQAPVGQARVILEIRKRVDAWRGFALGRAQEPYPDQPASYEPAAEGERSISPTTKLLLRHWFRHEPHILRDNHFFKYWPHQRRLIETFVYLYEVLRISRTEELYQLAGIEAPGKQRDPWPKLGGQLATGSGKTKMMSLIIAWSYFNAICEGDEYLGLGRHAILIAPGLFVRDRLLSDFLPPDGRPSVFVSDPIIPPELNNLWDLTVYDPATCPRQLDPQQGALIITNRHQLDRVSEALPSDPVSPDEQQMDLLFRDPEPERLEAVDTPLVERFARSRGLLVLNDEAHHVWDETGHARFEQKARDRAGLSEDESKAMAWIRAIRLLNGDLNHPGRVGLQVDLSATLFEETGAAGRRAGRTDFRPSDLFRHTVVDYQLREAIQDGIVKKPILERLVARKSDTGEIAESIRDGMPNAWETYRNLLIAGIKRWEEVQKQLKDEGDKRKPILFILCSKKEEAQEVANFLTYGKAVLDKDTSALPVTGFRYPDEPAGAALFVRKNSGGESISTVVQIHIGRQEEENEAAWERVRQAVNLIDHDQVRDPTGVPGPDGKPQMIDNPYNVVVSVMMLKEGWDVRNVKVIVPLRPSGSRTLTEQTLGRGLRKMHQPEIGEDGAVQPVVEELYVIEHPSFRAILDQISDIVEVRNPEDLTHAREYVPVAKKALMEERRAGSVRLVRFLGLVEEVPDWRKHLDTSKLPALSPKLPWKDEVSRVEIQTYLKEAMQERETEGQYFELPDVPSYLDLELMLEQVYADRLLNALQTSRAHRTAIKGVVREFLEKKTFKLPAGLPLSFDRMLLEGEDGLIIIGNLTRKDVRDAVHNALVPPLREALKKQVPHTEARVRVEEAAELNDYQALRRNVVENLKRSSFQRAAVGNRDEERVARLLDQAIDVIGWLYNHRSGIGYFIEYEWQGSTSRYFPDFVARSRRGEVIHNYIIEVKGRFDDRDRVKAQQAERFCDLLSEYDREPWHYLCLVENAPNGRSDISWWERQSQIELDHLWRHQESMPLVPDAEPLFSRRLDVVQWVPEAERYRDAVPVYDLAAAAGAFSEFQQPEVKGWARIKSGRKLSQGMFIAQVVGRSMEGSIPDGSWALFRAFPAGSASSAIGLDGRRVVVQLREQHDPETGGAYTLKRWRVARMGSQGVEAIDLVPENPDFAALHFEAMQGDLRVVAEFLEVVGAAEQSDDAEGTAAAPGARSHSGEHVGMGVQAGQARPLMSWVAYLREAAESVPSGMKRSEWLEAMRTGFASGLLSRLKRRYEILDGGSSLDDVLEMEPPGAQQVYVRRLLGVGALLCVSREPVQELLRKDPDVEAVLCGDDEAGEIPEFDEEDVPAERAWHLDAVAARSAHSRGITGSGVWIGVVDTGIDAEHPEFAERSILFAEIGAELGMRIEHDNLGQRIKVLPHDPVGHGTHVAGLLVGKTVGIAPGASLAVAKVTSNRRITHAAAEGGIDWLATVERPDGERGVDVLNLSFGFKGYDSGLRRLIARLRRIGVEVVASIGNQGPGKHSSPGNYAVVLGVGALDQQGQPWARCGGGLIPQEGGIHKPDYYAPGVGVYSCLPGGVYGAKSGTSMASPIVTGVVALVRQERGPSVDIRTELKQRAQTMRLGPIPAYKARF